MAILNNILKGQLKGRIGNTWFAHAKNSKGRPVTRAGSINETPGNPKTYKQMEQRARFANSVKFYQRATQNFFKFAFEDKKANESDYNAFMRHNIERSLVLPKDRVDLGMFPALGTRWMMSQGSLDVYIPNSLTGGLENNTVYETGIFGRTVAEASKHLIDYQGGKPGDIVTIVMIFTNVTRDNASSLDDVEHTPQWIIYQFVVDVNNQLSLGDLPREGLDWWDIETSSDVKQAVIFLDQHHYSSWATTIVTRKVNNVLKATNSYLLANIDAQQLEAIYQGREAINSALSSWGAKNAAILKGGVATRTNTDDVTPSVGSTKINSVQGADPPYTINNNMLDHQSIRVLGSNLPNEAPVSSAPDIASVEDFELNDAKTEADFSLVKGSKFGNFTVKYAGTTIIAGRSADGTDA